MKFRKEKGRSAQIKKTHRTVPIANYYRPAQTKPAATVIDTNQGAEKSRRLSLSRIVNYALAIGVLVIIAFSTTLSTNPVIELRKENAKYYESSVYQEAAREAQRSSILNQSKFLFQEASFIQQIKDKYPEVSVVKPLIPIGGRNLTVILAVSEPFAYVSSGSDTGILNREGVLVVKNPQTVPGELINLRFTEPQSNFSVGSRILTSSELDLLSLLVNEMNSLKFQDGATGAIREVLFNVADGQVEAKLQDKPFFVKLSTFTTDSDQQVGGAIATLKQLDKENTLPTSYIDVRVPGRAFVL